MNYGQIFDCDVANGPGLRVTLFVSGCTHHCPGCFNQDTWDFNYGQPFTDEVENKLLRMLSPTYIDGLTLLGGEPMEPANQRALLPFLRRVKAQMPHKSIWAYSGYTWEELIGQIPSRCRCEVTDEVLSLIDVLVDGPFIEAQKDITLRFRGSRNQRVLDVPQSLDKNNPMLFFS